MNKNLLNKERKEFIAKIEELLAKRKKPEYDLFYCHPSQDRIVLSHALFWVMPASFKGKIAKEKYLLLLRQYQEEMLDAWLTESPDFNELLHYCNMLYNTLPIILRGAYDLSIDRDARCLATICVVAGGYGGDMPKDQANEILDDMDFYHNKVKCCKIELLLQTLNKLVIEEQRSWRNV